ncbi:hypothetical protein STEG23_005941 [Scotinomys teguina]
MPLKDDKKKTDAGKSAKKDKGPVNKSGGKATKKKWSEDKVRDKLNHLVLFDKLHTTNSVFLFNLYSSDKYGPSTSSRIRSKDAPLGVLPALKPQGPQESGMATTGRNPPRPRVSPSPLKLLLLLGCCLLVAGKDKGAAGREAAPASGPTGGSSGRFVSPEQHACRWQLLVPAPGAPTGGELALRCQAPGGARLHCAYRGHPERCATSGARRSHYWRRLLGALRRKPQPCLDPTPLPPRLCARKKADAEPHPPARPTLSARRAQQSRSRVQSRARPRQPVRSGSSPPEEKPSRAKTSTNGRKAGSNPVPESPAVANGLDQNTELTETYCAEKWHSLCNFFVNFWNG